MPGGPTAGTGNGSGGTGTAPVGDCKIDAPPMTLADMTAKSQAINKLLVAALSCNLTRVYSHFWSGPRSDSTYPTLMLTGMGHHAYTHGSDGAEPRSMERYIMAQYADLVKVMKATPMGAGTVLDNTMIYGISDVAEPHDHIMKNYHIVLMGHAGGKLPGNRHFRAPGRRQYRCERYRDGHDHRCPGHLRPQIQLRSPHYPYRVLCRLQKPGGGRE